MKFIKFSAILLISLHIYAIPDFNEKSSVKSILEKCSSSEVKRISNLYVGKDLNKRCLVKEFNKVFKQDAHKNFFAYTDWSSGNGKKVIPEYETKIIDYDPGKYTQLNNQYSTKLNGIKSITSVWSTSCGEICKPAQDYLYESNDEFWYLIADSDAGSDMSVLKTDANGNPQLIFWTGYDFTRSINYLIHLVTEREFVLGSGNFSILEINLEEMKYKKSGAKSYFTEGGAFWYNSEITLNFSNNSSSWKYLNTKTSSCMEKEAFLNAAGWMNNPKMMKGLSHLKGNICFIQ